MLHEEVALLSSAQTKGGLWQLRQDIYYSIILNISEDRQDAHAIINISTVALQKEVASHWYWSRGQQIHSSQKKKKRKKAQHCAFIPLRVCVPCLLKQFPFPSEKDLGQQETWGNDCIITFPYERKTRVISRHGERRTAGPGWHGQT